MPRYLSVNSKFEPFSFQEKIAPLLMYKEEYDKTLSEYEKALAAADVLEVMKYSDVDADAYNQYKAEEQALQDAMNNFIDIGYNVNTRKDLWNAKERMNRLSIPMQAAYNRKLELIKEASANKDKSLEYFIDPNNVKVTDLMKNMGWTPQSFSKNELMNQGALISSGSSDLLLHGVPEFTTTADNKLLQRIQTQGFSDEDSAIIEALVRGYDVNASDIHYRAASAIANVIKNTGVLDWEDGARKEQAIESAINSVMTGFNSKLGKEIVNTISNPGYSKPGDTPDNNPVISYTVPGIANIEEINPELGSSKSLIENSYLKRLNGEDAAIKLVGDKVRVDLGDRLKFTSRIIEDPVIVSILSEHPEIKTLKQLNKYIETSNIAKFSVPLVANTDNKGSLYIANRVLRSINDANIDLLSVTNSKGKKIKKDKSVEVLNTIKGDKATVSTHVNPLLGNLVMSVSPEESEESYTITLDSNTLSKMLPEYGTIINILSVNSNALNRLFKEGEEFESDSSKKLQNNVKNAVEVLFGSLLDPLYGDTKPIR